MSYSKSEGIFKALGSLRLKEAGSLGNATVMAVWLAFVATKVLIPASLLWIRDRLGKDYMHQIEELEFMKKCKASREIP